MEPYGRDFDVRVQDSTELEKMMLSVEREDLYVNPKNGEIFDFKDCSVVISQEDDTFKVDGTLVTFNGAPLRISRLVSQYAFAFNRLENGHIQIYSEGDTREGKGIFIDLEGKIYRG